jgi:uncharacterized protein YkwD
LNRLRLSRRWHCAVAFAVAVVAGAATTAAAWADGLSAVQVLREGGCGGTLPAATVLHHLAVLDQAAEQWAAGRSLEAAAERSGYALQTSAGVHITGPDASMVQLLRQSNCRLLMDRKLHDIGVYQRGHDTWLVLASAVVVPSKSQAPVLAASTLRLVNEVRARGTLCGNRAFAPAAPLTASRTLDSVAFGHAADMAEHDYFEHEDRSGRSPAARVRAAGYREKLVGENIAYGPQSADDVVQGWLGSPGHCENIMDPRFTEMGIAYAPGRGAKRGLFWDQLLAAPGA